MSPPENVFMNMKLKIAKNVAKKPQFFAKPSSNVVLVSAIVAVIGGAFVFGKSN